MSGTSFLPPIQTYLSDAANEAKNAAKAAVSDGPSRALTSYFLTQAPKISSPDALLKDYKSLQVVLGAFGLGSKIQNTAILRQLLTQDPSSKSSLAYRLGDAKYLAFAKALSNWTVPPFGNPGDAAAIVKNYQVNRFETNVDVQSPGLQKALYFTRNIGHVTTITQLQSDPDLLAVVVTGLGLPLTNFQLLGFTEQTAILKSKVHLDQFAQPAAVQRLAEQYLVSQQLNPTASPGPPPGSLLSLFGGGNADAGNSILQILNPSSGTASAGATNNVLSLFA